MTSTATLAFNKLIDQLWNGELNEENFRADSLALGINPARIDTVLDDVREEDGVLS